MSTHCFLLKTYAKINITLDVVGVRDDGMHLLKSIVSFINIFDTMLINIGEKGPITFLPHPIEHSTVHKLRTLLDIPFSAIIYKHIPIGRGLGGSSSNAGGLLGALVSLGLIDRQTALEVAPKIGADVSMYLYNSPLLMEGIGEQITPIDNTNVPSTLYLTIPNFASSTPMIYRAWDEKPFYSHYTDRYLDSGIMGNGLTEAFQRVFGINIPQGIYLTGSGSSMFSLSPPTQTPEHWDIIEISTRKTGWEMMPCECKDIHTGRRR
jgi:4-diphosphocytidyl-2-C-methyl-D-erythritol kinase